MFDEDWTRYVLKMATGAGKTKVMSLLMAWCYFHKRYEPDSELSTNFLLIAPNIIVLDRLRTDFDGAQHFLRGSRSCRTTAMRARTGRTISRSPCISRMKSGSSARHRQHLPDQHSPGL